MLLECKQTAQSCHPTKKVNIAEELIYLSKNIAQLLGGRSEQNIAMRVAGTPMPTNVRLGCGVWPGNIYKEIGQLLNYVYSLVTCLSINIDYVYREIGQLLFFVDFLGGQHTRPAILPLGDVIFSRLAFPLNGIIFFLQLE